jgi:penicillin amidase
MMPMPSPDERPAAGQPAAPFPPRRRRRVLRTVGLGLLALVVLAAIVLAGAGLWFSGRVDASLPRLDGEVATAGVSAPVTVTRDAQGVPTLSGANRRDVAFALGYLHAQERFFRMDLQRRQAAGELAELFGAAALPLDREARRLRFRAAAERLWTGAPAADRELIEAYAGGVNTGLGDLEAPPFEYLVLRTEPRPWSPEDTLLTVYAMFNLLQGDAVRAETGRGLMHELLAPELYAFLTPPGSSWDAPIEGEAFAALPPPGPEVIDLRQAAPAADRAAALGTLPAAPRPVREPPAEPAIPGSNNWAVAGRLTADGGALLANDMHLPLGLPNIWYRASLEWPAADGGTHRVTGVTLPGVPLMVVGSNGHVAWGFTNAQADITDLVLLEIDPADPEVYRTPDGPRRFEHATETLRVAGGGEETLELASTVWGPVLPDDALGRPRALAWVVYEPGGLDLAAAARLETAGGLEEALDLASRIGLPAQNFVVAAADGRIGWTIAGRLPQRVGFDGSVPASWADGGRRWEGLLPSEATPRVVDPPGGRIWTANNRVVGGEMGAAIGSADFVSGARAGQIRDGLAAIDRATPADMLAVQLDDRAVFLGRWQRLWLEALDEEALAADPRRREARELIEGWGGHASVGSVGYRLVRGARNFLIDDVSAALTAPCKQADPDFSYSFAFLRPEGPVWRLVELRPAHLVPPGRASWDEVLLAAIDRTLDYYQQLGLPLAEATWGRFNTVQLHHPFTSAMPLASRWLDLEPAELPGDNSMPRVQMPGYGSSERLVVSPGREADGIFHMPGGQSGHPRSPNYGDGQAAWESGEPTPFLPGPPVHTLRFTPAG